MKITEMISHLESLKAEHGDLECLRCVDDIFDPEDFRLEKVFPCFGHATYKREKIEGIFFD